MNTVIRQCSYCACTISYDCAHTGERITRYIYAPHDRKGAYVYETGNKQVCARLASRGPTLWWDGKAPLADLIRQEYLDMRREEKRQSDKGYL